MKKSVGRAPSKIPYHQRKKRPKLIGQEVTREVEELMQALFNGRRKTSHHDLEAIEMTVRSAIHPAGAAVLTQLLQLPADHRTVACPCGQQAHYQELRAKSVLTAVGRG
jgi:hypothetical protein